MSPELPTAAAPAGAATLPPLLLAYLGDAVYELRVREHLLAQGLARPDALHGAAVGYVNAERQSRLYAEIEALLTPEEREIFRHGRNARSGHQPPHTSVGAYRRATGVEALIGYLYLCRREDRLNQIFAVLFRDEG